MKRVFDLIRGVVTNAGINASVGVITVLIAFCIAIITLAYKHPILIAPAIIIFSLCSYLENLREPPAPAIIAENAATFLERAIGSLHDRLSVFQCLYYDKIPIEGGGVERYPRWPFWRTMQSGVTVVRVGVLCANKMKPSKETLAQESAILQGILLDDLQRGLIPLVAHPTYTDGTPTLSLVGVGQYGQYMTFSFVWVNSRKTADYVHLHDIPPVSDDADDRDF